jgi:hypothetical protein
MLLLSQMRPHTTDVSRAPDPCSADVVLEHVCVDMPRVCCLAPVRCDYTGLQPTQAECQGDATNGAVSERALDNNTTCTYIVKMRACTVLDEAQFSAAASTAWHLQAAEVCAKHPLSLCDLNTALLAIAATGHACGSNNSTLAESMCGSSSNTVACVHMTEQRTVCWSC